MPTYLMLFVGRTAQPDADDPVTQDYNQQWVAYMGGLAQQGVLRGGAPLSPTGLTVGRDGNEPFATEEIDVGGYLVVEAATLEAAAELAQGAPHIALGGTTIVREALPAG
jgi:hypothetical protein